MSGRKFYPSQWQQRERKHSPRGAHDLIALPWAGKEANGELVLPSPQPTLFSHDAGIKVGDNGTSSTSLSPGSCHLEFSGLKGEHRPWTDKLVPGLTYQFGENLEGTHSITYQHFPETALALAGGCPGPQGQWGEVSKAVEGQVVCSVE